jgi:hypothetical protein
VSGGTNLRVIADTAQQAVGDARRAPAAARDFFAALFVDFNLQQLRGTFDDARELRRSTRPKRPRRGALINPWRVVAPMAVKRLISIATVRAPGPVPMRMSMRKSSSAE